ncbi:hypothetical protein DNH61_04220 [Paenibacillus sambharensis]|uniref:Uncharacterized protein n=1 Tax=Paenibacillus sambharensis TaxID=1803190 RepID=A0A2W1LQ88_9BACL|nr:DUF5696 domain-containing protein [Paenibacillus sambharensis]PZD97102.1 hypothetical protein DNH61_04220 [Paenibacillus sambharensis]
MIANARSMLLGACLMIGVLVAGCSDDPDSADSGGSGQGITAFEQSKPLAAAFTDSRAAGMKGIAENDSLRLLTDDLTGAVAVVHKASGAIWHSNPIDRDTDSLAAGVNKSELSAQLKLHYYNSFGQLNAVNSYSDAALHKQLSFEAIPDGVRVNYQFGTSAKTAEDMPQKISSARFEGLLAKLDKAGQRALMLVYTADKESPVYVRNDGALKGLQLDRALKAFEEAGYTEDELAIDIEENNLNQTKPEPRLFFASIEYTLDGDSLVARVPVDSIRYPEQYPLNQISLLSYFGAGGLKEEGAILVPDGSGALIRFNNGKIHYPAYQQPVYGSDKTMDRTLDALTAQEIRLPVFGILKEGSAMLGIIEQGAPAAVVSADISGKINSYNYVYPGFTVLNKTDMSLNANDQQRTIPAFQKKPVSTDFSVRYAFLAGEQASTEGLANYYRQYLIRNNGLTEPRETDGISDNIPFYLQLIGSISKQKHFAGIPYQALEPLTTFEQAQDILTQLQQLEIRDIKLRYAGWFNQGLDHKAPNDISVDKAIGGSKGMKALSAFAEKHGISLYPDVAVLMANSSSDFNEAKEAARTLPGDPAAVYPLDLAINRRDRSRNPAYVVSPGTASGYVDNMLDELADFRTGGISLRDLADQLNSDFRKSKVIDRAESERLSVQSLNKIREAGMDIMAEGGNAYAFPFLKDVVHAPMSSSKFKIEDEEVPFYQMVVRGYIDYAGAPYNLSTFTDVKPYILKCLEFGANVYFEWIYEPNYKVKDTEHSELYAVNYELWIDEAADIYREVNAILKNVRHEPITGHEQLEKGVYRTEYGNGMYIIVNYNRSAVTIDGRMIEAESYITGGEQS